MWSPNLAFSNMAAEACVPSSLQPATLPSIEVTHCDHVSVELLSHQVPKVDPDSLAEQEGAVVCNLHTCMSAKRGCEQLRTAAGATTVHRGTVTVLLCCTQKQCLVACVYNMTASKLPAGCKERP